MQKEATNGTGQQDSASIDTVGAYGYIAFDAGR